MAQTTQDASFGPIFFLWRQLLFPTLLALSFVTVFLLLLLFVVAVAAAGAAFAVTVLVVVVVALQVVCVVSKKNLASRNIIT